MPHNSFLYDHNLPSSLVVLLDDLFPNSTHTKFLTFDRTPDSKIWKHAKANDLHVMTRDGDFEFISNQQGFPPKVILIRKQKCSPKMIEGLIRGKIEIINRFLDSKEHGCLILRE